MGPNKPDQFPELILEERGKARTLDLTPGEAEFLRGLRTGLNNRPAFSLSPIAAQPGWFSLKAQGCAGVVQTMRRTIIIRPHLCVGPYGLNIQLLRLMDYAYGWGGIQFADHADLDAKEGLFEWLIRVYVREVNKLIRKGIRKRFVSRYEELPYARGRLMMREHQRLTLTKPGRFPCVSTLHSAATPENLLLQAALEYAGKKCKDLALRSRVKALGLEFAAQTHVECVRDVPKVSTLDRLHSHYAQAVTLARMVMGSLGPVHAVGDAHSNAFLVDMWHLFERFLQTWFEEHTPDIRGQASRTIQAHPKETGYSATFNPDYLFLLKGRPQLVGDAKYKAFSEYRRSRERLIMGNVHQVFAYTSIFSVDGALFYPTHSDRSADLTIPLPTGRKVHIRTISWDTLLDDPAAAEELKKWIEEKRTAGNQVQQDSILKG